MAGLIEHLGLERPDVVGYSMGAGVTLQLGMRHHGAARRLVAASASFSSAGIQPEAWAMFPSISPEMFAGTLFRLLGGGGMGDLSGLPASQLAILPGTTHSMPPGTASSTARTGCCR